MMLPRPRFFSVEGEVVKVWGKPDGSLTCCIWRNGAWVKGGDLVDSDFKGRLLSPGEITAVIGGKRLLPELTLPRYSFVEGDIVRTSRAPEGGLMSSVWRNGSWIEGGSSVEADFRGSALFPAEVAAMLGDEAIKS
jgi:hypothetical protein